MLNLELKINIKIGAEILSWSKIEKMELYLKTIVGTAKFTAAILELYVRRIILIARVELYNLNRKLAIIILHSFMTT